MQDPAAKDLCSATTAPEPLFAGIFAAIMLAAAPALPAPAGTKASVRLTWDPNPEFNLTGYRVHYGPDSRTYLETLDAGTRSSTQLTSLTPGETYYCVITAVNTLGLESDYSNEISFSIPPRPASPLLQAPVVPQTPSGQSGSAQLSWTLSEEPHIAGYRLHYGPTAGEFPSKSLDVDDQTSVELAGLVPGETYICAVTAYNSYGTESDYSNQVSFTVPFPPEGPELLKAFVHGLDPDSTSRTPVLFPDTISIDGVDYAAIRYRMRATSLSRVRVVVERSLDLRDPQGWHSGHTILEDVRASADTPGMIEFVARSVSRRSKERREFFRLRYESLAPVPEQNSLQFLLLSDLDRLTTLKAYAHAIDPDSSLRLPVLIPETIEIMGRQYAGVRYRVRESALDQVRVIVERSTDLRNPNGWRSKDAVLADARTPPDALGTIEFLSRSMTPLSESPREFFRLRYEFLSPPPPESAVAPSGPLAGSDQITTLGAYVHGLEPGIASHDQVSFPETIEIDGVSYRGIGYRVMTSSLSRARVVVERSSDPSDPNGWERGQTVLSHVDLPPEAPGMLEFVVRSKTPTSESPADYFRLRYELLGPAPDGTTLQQLAPDLNPEEYASLRAFVHGLDPDSGSSERVLSPEIVQDNGAASFGFRYRLRVPSLSHVEVVVERSLDLTDPLGWRPAPAVVTDLGTVPDQPDMLEYVLRSASPVSGHPNAFYRLRYQLLTVQEPPH